ncbi:anti-sigma factor [Phyllobacterium phragmitis]|uniref:Anti-sigma factor n=1 Tax=Phyllobacterium phragmitis TaxID=2670329 RepID=A0A2S9IPR1_9HYPH|nr:anti-sigma factor [Phyllobacterium phragmitis]PRD42519.1 anti-sigma factor [Phyllobacterium phragmitis]
MSREKYPVTDDALHAYVDGVLEARDRAVVENHLASNPADAETVESWSRQNEALRALYGHVGEEPVPEHLGAYRIADDRKTASRNWQRMAAAGIVLFAMGAAGGWFGHNLTNSTRSAPMPLVEEAVAAHNLYASEIIHPVEVRADQSAHLAAWLSKRLDRPLDIPDLRALGFDLVGGRLLPAGGRPAAQFMYEDKTGRRVTLYIVPTSNGPESSFHYTTLDGLEAFFWRDETINCALVGGLPRAELRQIAMQAYKELG